MAKGYPSLVRARKAFTLGFYGWRSRNPYRNTKLHELFERGQKKAAERVMAGQEIPRPPKPLRPQNRREESQSRRRPQRRERRFPSASEGAFRPRPWL
jgi:hypothetical protein